MSQCVDESYSNEMSSIQEFYKDQTVFLTGATGFIGKLLVEKLLRTCPDLNKIYLLVRPKRNRPVQQRLEEMFNCVIFDQVKSTNSDVLQKVQLVNGDCNLPLLGLNQQDQEILKSEVSCVIHAAANVRFDTDLKSATYINVRSVKDLVDLAKEMKKLRAFVYVSTAYAHCHRSDVREEFYNCGLSPEKILQLVEILDEDTLREITPQILGPWANTYVYTKAIAEQVIRNNSENIPWTIVRPAIVMGAVSEPLPGYIANFQGAMGLVVGVGLGAIKCLNIDAEANARLVPVDYVVNAILAAGWSVEQLRKEPRNKVLPIYNMSSHKSNFISWGWAITNTKKYRFIYPYSDTVWYPTIQTTKSKIVYKIRIFFSHILFAYVADMVLLLMGRKPLAVDKYRKIHKLVSVVAHFTAFFNCEVENSLRLFEKLDDNDKKMFNFDVRKIDWDQFLDKNVIGGRLYLMKDPLETVPKAKRKMYILMVVHYCCLALLWYFLYCMFFRVLRLF